MRRRREAPNCVAQVVLTGMLAVHTAACGELIGVDEYEVGDGTDAGMSTTELPLLPALPDSDAVSSCEQCAAVNCDAERRACLESERCRALLSCHGTCRDPNCMYRCRDTEPESATFEEYFACVFGPFGGFNYVLPQSRCPEQCRAGANWGCVKNYVWDRVQPGQATMDVTITVANARSLGTGFDGLRYVEVAVCEELLQGGATGELVADGACDPFEMVGFDGNAQLALGRRRSAFVLRGGVTGDERSRIYDRPIPRAGRLDLWTFTFTIRDTWLPAFFSTQDPPVELEPDQGMIFFGTRDCTGVSATARVEIADPSEGSPVRYYWAGYGQPGPESDPTPSGGFVAVPPSSNVVLTGYHPITGDELARRTLMVVGRWSTMATLYPSPRP